jgi:hypothetical protein
MPDRIAQNVNFRRGGGSFKPRTRTIFYDRAHPIYPGLVQKRVTEEALLPREFDLIVLRSGHGARVNPTPKAGGKMLRVVLAVA